MPLRINELKEDVAEVLQTAWPLMLSTGLFSVTLFVDRMLLYRYNDASAAAAMAAGTLFWSLTCFPSGVCGYTSTFVAQYLADKRPERALKVVWQGILLALAVGPFLILCAVFCKLFFLWSGHEAILASREADYFRWLLPAAWANVIGSALVGLYAGSGRTRVLVLSDVVATIVNIVLDQIFIFGLFGLPEMGAAGAALASSIALILKVLILIYCALPDFQSKLLRHRDPQSKKLVLEQADYSVPPLQSILEWPLMARLFRFGWPAGVSVVAEAWSFTIIMIMVGRLGEKPAAATTLALGVNLLAFIPLVGLGIAVGVLVGKYLIQEKKEIARRMVKSGLLIGVAYSLIFVILYGGFPEWVMQVYSLDVSPERFDEMRPMLKPLLYFIAGYCVFDAFQTVYVGALKGAGDTHFVLWGHILCGGLSVSGGILGSYLLDANNLYYWWTVITIWVVMLAFVFTLRYIHGGWQNKRVIEKLVDEIESSPS